MAEQVLNPRFRGFICTSAHPVGCAANVAAQVAVVKKAGAGTPIMNALVLGSSAGYGLASLITAVFGHGARALGVCFDRNAAGERSGSAGWYNLAEVHRQARAAGRQVETINGDGFSAAIKTEVVAALKARFAPIDLLVYSLAAPQRTHPVTGVVHKSVLKPIGAAYTAKTVDLDTEQVKPITIQPASDADIANTVAVMGGEDWEMWITALRAAGLLAPGFRTVAYSYIGPQVTHAIYRAGTIGRAKDDLEATAHRLDAGLKPIGGNAWVSVNKALVTQASSAIPVVPLYISLLYQVMKEAGTHEGTIEQMVRLFRDHIGPGRTPKLDEAGRIRIDDREMDPKIQTRVAALWEQVDSGNLATISDFAGFRREFRGLYGYELDAIDYAKAVELDRPLI